MWGSGCKCGGVVASVGEWLQVWGSILAAYLIAHTIVVGQSSKPQI